MYFQFFAAELRKKSRCSGDKLFLEVAESLDGRRYAISAFIFTP